MKIKDFNLNRSAELANFLANQTNNVINAARWIEFINIIWLNNPYTSEKDSLGWYIEDEGQIKGFIGRVKITYSYNNAEINASFVTSWYVEHNYRFMGMELLKKLLSINDLLLSVNAIHEVKVILKSGLCNFKVIGPSIVRWNYIPAISSSFQIRPNFQNFKFQIISFLGLIINFINGKKNHEFKIYKNPENNLRAFQKKYIKDKLYFELNAKNIKWLIEIAKCNIWTFYFEDNIVGYVVWKEKIEKKYEICEIIDYFIIDYFKKDLIKSLKWEIEKVKKFHFIKISGKLYINKLISNLIYKRDIINPNLYYTNDGNEYNEIVDLNPDRFSI